MRPERSSARTRVTWIDRAPLLRGLLNLKLEETRSIGCSVSFGGPERSEVGRSRRTSRQKAGIGTLNCLRCTYIYVDVIDKTPKGNGSKTAKTEVLRKHDSS